MRKEGLYESLHVVLHFKDKKLGKLINPETMLGLSSVQLIIEVTEIFCFTVCSREVSQVYPQFGEQILRKVFVKSKSIEKYVQNLLNNCNIKIFTYLSP